MRLADFPRPLNESRGKAHYGFSMHGTAANDNPLGYDPSWAIEQMLGMKFGWCKLLDSWNQDCGSRLLDVGMMPICRPYMSYEGAADIPGDVWEKLHREVASGVRYIESCHNEPNLESKHGPGALDYYRQLTPKWIHFADSVIAAGGLPSTPAEAPGGDWGALDGFYALLFSLQELGRLDLFGKGVWVAIHNYHSNHPISYPLDPIAQADKPGLTVRQDPYTFLVFTAFHDILHEFGVDADNIPVISTEGGPYVNCQDDNRYPRTTHAAYADMVLQCRSYMSGQPLPGIAPDYMAEILYGNATTPDAPPDFDALSRISKQRDEAVRHPAPDYFFSTNFWLLLWNEGLGSGGFRQHAWWSPDWDGLGYMPVVDELKSLPPAARAEITPAPEPEPKPEPPSPPPPAPPMPDRYYAVTRIERLPPDQNNLMHNIFFSVKDEAGKPLANVPIRVEWPTGFEKVFTKADGTDIGTCDFPMYPGAYTAKVDTAVYSEIAGGMATDIWPQNQPDYDPAHPELYAGNDYGHWSYWVDFTLKETPVEVDYPGAEWVPSPNFNGGRTEAGVQFFVLHWTAGSLESTLSHFQKPDTASAHYVLDRSGKWYQMVKEVNTAWQAGEWNANLLSIGIETVADANNPPTEAQYAALAAFLKAKCRQYGLPLDRTSVIGHNEVIDPTSPTGKVQTQCPGLLDVNRVVQMAQGVMVDLERAIRNFAWNSLYPQGIAYNPTFAFPQKARELGMNSLPVTNELRLEQGSEHYAVQGFIGGILYCKDGDWTNIRKIGWQE